MMNWLDTSGRPDGAPAPTLSVTVASQSALLADLDARFAAGQGFAVATLNLDHVVKLGREPAFRAAYLRHSHVTADGNPVVWLSRLARQPVTLVPGSDLILPLAQLAARNGVGLALFGASRATLEAAAQALKAAVPGLSVVFSQAPPMGFDPAGPAADAALAAIGASGARLCLLALGAPKQEILAARGLDRLPGVGFVSIGAGLDFIAGTRTRAPRWVRAVAAEWLWRLAQEPGRLAGRYLGCGLILPRLLGAALRARATNRTAKAAP